ncbi:prepilin-type N-terminal cleavage/methylation domain-containing protein, partial [[Clostridium] symbiosum]
MGKNTDTDKGFSLIELIIAIAILIILTGLLAPQFMKYIEKSRKAVCMN